MSLSGKHALLGVADSKHIYKDIRDRVIVQPTAQKKYTEQVKNYFLNWKDIYSLPHQVALDTKLREFQYKLLNRSLATNDFLNTIGIVSSPLCSLCDVADESLKHLFVSCQNSENFWAEVI